MRPIRVALLLVLSLAAACTSSPSSPPSPAGTSPTANGAADLAALLPASPPDGYTPVEDQSGPITLEEAAARADDPEAERKRLGDNGFVRGYARTWQNEGGDVIVLLVDEYGSDAGAKSGLDDSVAEAAESGATRFEVSEVPGAVGLTQPEGEGDVFHAVAFVRGKRLFVAAVGGGTADPAAAVAFAGQILRLL